MKWLLRKSVYVCMYVYIQEIFTVHIYIGLGSLSSRCCLTIQEAQRKVFFLHRFRLACRLHALLYTCSRACYVLSTYIVLYIYIYICLHMDLHLVESLKHMDPEFHRCSTQSYHFKATSAVTMVRTECSVYEHPWSIAASARPIIIKYRT